MNNDTTTPKPPQPEQPSPKGLDDAACCASSPVTPGAVLSEDTLITREILESLGFYPPDHQDTCDLELLARDDIMLWDVTQYNEGWMSWALDQGGLHVRFYTLGDLERFWIGCQRPSILHNAEVRHGAKDADLD